MYQYSQGRATTQGHKGIPEGHFEEEQGRKGFFGPVSHLIKQKPSTRWSKITGELRPHLFDTPKLEKKFGSWQRLLFNSDVVLSYYWDRPASGTVTKGFRNADGDTIYFCHSGAGSVVTEYGLLHFNKGTYLVMPKCVTHSFLFSEETCFLVIESKSSFFREPDRGMVGRNGFYDQAAIVAPNLDAQLKLQTQRVFKVTEVTVKRAEQITSFEYEDCYYDTVGWKGDFFPFTLHVNDLMPLMSARVHLPPSAHTTFVAQGFVVCTFLPRPLEQDADALKVPFYHQNIDYDEVLFYHDGNFFSRDNLHAGMISFHPAGFPHGPHPKAVKNITTKTHTDEYAVMIDSLQHLSIDENFKSVEVNSYWSSWMPKDK